MNQDQIKQARHSLGLSQSEMAKALGLTCVKTYQKWESGENKPTASAITSIEMLLYMRDHAVLMGWLERK
ncbi:MAG: helix-turn-helix domain-containing protein [Aeromonadaceae bacterium]